MRVTFIPPIDYCIGKVSMKSEFYFRRNKYGKVFVQRCPRRLSEKQKAWNKQFARLYAGKHHRHNNRSRQVLRLQTLPKKQMRGILQGKQTVQQYLERNDIHRAAPAVNTYATATPTTPIIERTITPMVTMPPPETPPPDHTDSIGTTGAT